MSHKTIISRYFKSPKDRCFIIKPEEIIRKNAHVFGPKPMALMVNEFLYSLKVQENLQKYDPRMKNLSAGFKKILLRVIDSSFSMANSKNESLTEIKYPTYSEMLVQFDFDLKVSSAECKPETSADHAIVYEIDFLRKTAHDIYLRESKNNPMTQEELESILRIREFKESLKAS